jgi:hypothetical protein
VPGVVHNAVTSWTHPICNSKLALNLKPDCQKQAAKLPPINSLRMSNSEYLIIYPMPSLVATLINREKAKGSPLTEAEVIQIRDACPSVAVPVDVAQAIDEKRGYKDIDPENCWAEWQEARMRPAKDEPPNNA